MNRKRIVALILVLMCSLGAVGCKGESKVNIKPITMNLDINTVPYKDIKKEWSNMNLDKYVLRTAQQIWNGWRALNKVWPGVDYSKYNVLYVETNGENAWLISPNKKITKFNQKDLPKKLKAEGNPTMFSSSETKFNNEPTIKVEVDSGMFVNSYDNGEFESLPNSSGLFPLTTHEEFHHFQDNWHLKSIDQENLNEKGKDNFKAREQRLEILNSLNKAILEPENEQQHLEGAKYWFEKYKKDNEKEYNAVKVMDVLEGTARYFDMASNVRSIKGMDLSKEEAFKAYQDMVRLDYVLSSSRFFGLPDEESYDIGGAAGVILEKHNNDEWKEIAQKGTPPVEILLKDYKAIPQKPSPEVKKLIEDIKAKRK